MIYSVAVESMEQTMSATMDSGTANGQVSTLPFRKKESYHNIWAMPKFITHN